MTNFIERTSLYEKIQDEKIYTPKQINHYLGNLIDKDQTLKNIWIEGEVYNFSQASSGHIYFSLKEGDTTLDCTYFKTRQNNFFLNQIEIKNGITLLAFGDVIFYKKVGKCQFNVKKISEGNRENLIYKRILQTYEKLLKEGLLDEKRKRKLPFLPITIGIATSEFGAAIRDIIQVSKNRFPEINIIIAPCVVQGEEAIESITKAIEILNDPIFNVDVIIAGRGGGSFDDLLPFNEETVVRAFANSKIPIVAAVGHQINKPLCEFAADKAAATPSNAAEITVPEIEKIKSQLKYFEERIKKIILTKIQIYQTQLKLLTHRKLYEDPFVLLENYYQTLDETIEKIKLNIQKIFQKNANGLILLEEKLKRLNPEEPLRRGYALIQRKNTNEYVKQAKSLREKEMIYIRFYRDSLVAEVVKIT
ncbi:MAG: exodeoxyribonuclease VII large subunit [Leptonema sp. (in: bacteria)]